MREQATAVQRAKESAPPAIESFEGIANRMSEAFNDIARRAFEIFDSRGRAFGRDLDDWLQAESEVLHPVHLEVEETDGALTVRAEVPGFESNDLTINVEPRRLTISGKRETNKEQKKGKTIHREQCSDEILRSVELPSEVDASQATATLKNGILELHMPKVAKAGPTRVQVKAR
jgi:HSP20 family protein